MDGLLVKFGGSILINIGYNDKTGATGLLFSETKEEHKPGEKLTEGEETYGGQVQFEFDNLKSLEILRNALDLCEYALKYGEIPEVKEETENENN